MDTPKYLFEGSILTCTFSQRFFDPQTLNNLPWSVPLQIFQWWQPVRFNYQHCVSNVKAGVAALYSIQFGLIVIHQRFSWCPIFHTRHTLLLLNVFNSGYSSSIVQLYGLPGFQWYSFNSNHIWAPMQIWIKLSSWVFHYCTHSTQS